MLYVLFYCFYVCNVELSVFRLQLEELKATHQVDLAAMQMVN